MVNAKSYTLGTLAELLEVRLIGDKDCRVDGLSTLEGSQPGKLCFLNTPSYVQQLATCQAAAVILEEKYISACPVNKLVTAQPYVAFARASQVFDNSPQVRSGVHPSACIHESVDLPNDVGVGANSVIEEGVEIGPGTIVGSGCFIGSSSILGENCRIYSNVSIYHRVVFGKNVVVHAGAVIGADGFGFAFDGNKSVKIHQLGSVVVGDDVEIGAGTTIDRGAIDDTLIERGVKIDNQVQIGHNCKIGSHTVICGCTAIAGSATIGSYCVLGGASGVVGHISIADRVRVGAMSLVSRSISEAGDYSSGTGITDSSQWRRNIVRFNQLDELGKRLKKLENRDK